MLAIIDYGVGNLFSLKASLSYIGEEAVVTGDADVLRKADRVILPGVGAFGDAAESLRATGLMDTVRELAASGKPLMGICLGMQLLFEKSYEFGCHEGLGLLPGNVCSMQEDLAAMSNPLKVPEIGWNALKFEKSAHPLLRYIHEGDFVYYVHSFYAKTTPETLVATSEYGVTVPGIVAKDNVFGCQFHPEKSGDVGLSILKAFCEVSA